MWGSPSGVVCNCDPCFRADDRGKSKCLRKSANAETHADNGTYFQVLPYHIRKYTNHSRLTVNGNPLNWDAEWLANSAGTTRAPRAITNAEVVFGGVAGDTTSQITSTQADGKFVVLLAAKPAAATGNAGRGGGGGRGGFATQPNCLAGAAAIAIVDLDDLTAAQRVAINEPRNATAGGNGRGGGGRGGRGGNDTAPVDSLALLKTQLAAQLPPIRKPRLRAVQHRANRPA